MEFLKSLFKILSYVPLVWLGLLYSFALLNSIELGHFPVKYIDDPKNLGLFGFYVVTFFGLFITFYNVFIWIALFAVALRKKWPIKGSVIVFSVGMALVFIQMICDPFDLIAWLLD